MKEYKHRNAIDLEKERRKWISSQPIDPINESQPKNHDKLPRLEAIKRLESIFLSEQNPQNVIAVSKILSEPVGQVTDKEKAVALIRIINKGYKLIAYDKSKKQRAIVNRNLDEIVNFISDPNYWIVLENSESQSQPENPTINIETTLKEDRKISWQVKVLIQKAFYMPSEEGDRNFVVVELEGETQEGEKIKFTQPFYQSTGKNSGYAGKWFPCRGTFPKGLEEHIVKLENSRVPKSIPVIKNGVVATTAKNPFTRLGSPEKVSEYGQIYAKVSNELGKLSIKPKKEVTYEEVNQELKNISPEVDIQFQPGTDFTHFFTS